MCIRHQVLISGDCKQRSNKGATRRGQGEERGRRNNPLMGISLLKPHDLIEYLLY
jgi:hypothetical protein